MDEGGLAVEAVEVAPGGGGHEALASIHNAVLVGRPRAGLVPGDDYRRSSDGDVGLDLALREQVEVEDLGLGSGGWGNHVVALGGGDGVVAFRRDRLAGRVEHNRQLPAAVRFWDHGRGPSGPIEPMCQHEGPAHLDRLGAAVELEELITDGVAAGGLEGDRVISGDHEGSAVALAVGVFLPDGIGPVHLGVVQRGIARGLHQLGPADLPAVIAGGVAGAFGAREVGVVIAVAGHERLCRRAGVLQLQDKAVEPGDIVGVGAAGCDDGAGVAFGVGNFAAGRVGHDHSFGRGDAGGGPPVPGPLPFPYEALDRVAEADPERAHDQGDREHQR